MHGPVTNSLTPHDVFYWCQRQIPGPADLESQISKVIEKFKQVANDEQLGELLTDSVMNELSNLLGHVRKGCLSDPKDLKM